MKDNTPKKLTGNGHAGSNTGDFIDPLISFAQEHFATDFPNPERIDCPAPEIYPDLISRKQLPNEQLQAHLRSCSECFRAYHSLLEAQRKSVLLKPNWSTPALWYKRVLTFGIPIVLIGIAFYGFYSFYQTKRQRSEQGASSQPQQSRPAIPNIEPIPSTNPNKQAPVTQQGKPSPAPAPPPMVAAHTVMIDFGRQRISRSASQREIPAATFVAGLNRLTVRLSTESPRGEYSLTLNNPFGKEVRPPVAGMFDGSALHAELDLNSVAPGKYLICITRAAEVPDCLPAMVKAK